jgi:RNA polymerase sigma factor (TIGR02999 family)
MGRMPFCFALIGMSAPPPATGITALLTAWKQGDRSVETALVAQIYPVLRDLSRAQVRRHAGVLTLAPTELANEAFERLHRQRSVDWQNRQHFFAVASTVIRRVVIDYIRERKAEKRGGDVVFVQLDDVSASDLPSPSEAIDWLAFDQALTELAQADPECARLVELRVFSCLTVDQIADLDRTSPSTVARRWRFARAWLSARLGNPSA